MPAQRRAAGGAAARPPAAATAAAPAAGDSGADKAKRAPTPYELRVYKLCSAVPEGRVTTYGDLARALSPPSSARAVGQAMRRNPFAPRVPCHRVVASDLRLGGFSGSWGPETANVKRKRQMLAGEGVAFEAEDRIAAACVVHAAELAALAEGAPDGGAAPAAKRGAAGGGGGASPGAKPRR